MSAEINTTNAQSIMPNNDLKSKEENIVWDVEVWKRAEQTKFKAYLKQLEYEYLSKLQEDFKIKEEQREKEFKKKINEINLLKNKLTKKASELESRENKITLCEEELKLKINEVSKQLLNKDEEINYLKNRFKEEKNQLNNEKKNLNKIIDDKNKKYEQLNKDFEKYKKEIEESPLSVLKNEINKKQIINEELEKEKNRILNELNKSKEINEKLKNDLIKMKKAYDTEKENLYKQRMEEIEKLKFEIYNQKMSENEMNELKDLREKLKNLTGGNNENGNLINNNTINYNNNNLSLPNNTNQSLMAGTQPIKKNYKILTYNRKERPNEFDSRNEIERLNKERDMLLSGGMYTETDPLIVQLDIKIRKLIQNSQNY